ncbi:MAG: DUF748 domain-containing protein [Bacteroidetes bacterium]|nr:DUF748 domain-containing protein [Bacteroidota bacterium]
MVLIIAILFVSYGTKYVIEKYDEKYLGRNITLSSAYVNVLTGAIRLNNFSIYEFQSDSVFIAADAIVINISLWKLFDHTFELSELTINHPAGIVIQNKKQLNITDLIKKFSSKNDSGSTSYFEHINLLNVKITDGTFTFRENEIPIDYTIKKVSIESEGKRWDADSVSSRFSFVPQSDSGDVKGKATINLKNLDYKLAISVHNFDLNIIAQYLKDITNYGSFKATLDADVNTNGNFNDEENVTIKGQIAIKDFHFGKNAENDFASFDRLILAIREISPKKFIYTYDSISLLHPYFKYERYEKLNNLETMFGENGNNIAAANADSARFNLVIEIAKHIRVLSKNFFASHFKIDRLVLKDGEIIFNDYSFGEKFSCALDPLNVEADSIDEKRNRVEVNVKAAIKPYGSATLALSINPKDSSDFDLKYNFRKMSAAMFNPYIIPLTSFPLDRGTAEIHGDWHVTNGNILSNNHLVIIDPRLANRQKNNASKYIPMRLLMYFVREQGNVIDYEIPIAGNLNNPKFQLRDVVMDAIENLFVKPVTTVYRTQVKNAESEIETSLMLNWEMTHPGLNPKQEKFLRSWPIFLTKTPMY